MLAQALLGMAGCCPPPSCTQPSLQHVHTIRLSSAAGVLTTPALAVASSAETQGRSFCSGPFLPSALTSARLPACLHQRPLTLIPARPLGPLPGSLSCCYRYSSAVHTSSWPRCARRCTHTDRESSQLNSDAVGAHFECGGGASGAVVQKGRSGCLSRRGQLLPALVPPPQFLPAARPDPTCSSHSGHGGRTQITIFPLAGASPQRATPTPSSATSGLTGQEKGWAVLSYGAPRN